MSQIEILRGKHAELNEVAGFIGKAFAADGVPLDIKALLPKVFCQDSAERFRLLRVGGQIRGLLLYWPFSFRLQGGAVLPCASIGAVCVDPQHRGSGYMQILMENLDREMQEDKIAIAVLNGERNLYRRYGYDMAGSHYTFILSRKAVEDQNPVCTVELTGIEPFAHAAHALYQTRNTNVSAALREITQFTAILSSWGAKPFAACKNGVFAGYISIAGNILWEVELQDPKLYPELMQAIFSRFNLDSCKVILPPAHMEKVEYFTAICESRQLSWNHNYKFYAPVSDIDGLFVSELDLV